MTRIRRIFADLIGECRYNLYLMCDHPQTDQSCRAADAVQRCRCVVFRRSLAVYHKA
jgi:hypothetical protein